MATSLPRTRGSVRTRSFAMRVKARTVRAVAVARRSSSCPVGADVGVVGVEVPS